MEATLSTSQVICVHCEELVHRYAARCPYCQHDLVAPAPLVALSELHFAPNISVVKERAPQSDTAGTGTTSKITPLTQDPPKKAQTQSQLPKDGLSKDQLPKTMNVGIKTATAAKPQSVLPTFESIEAEQKLLTQSSQESLVKVLLALVALLGGSFFAFFGLMLKMFSKNGRLVLEWNAETWPYYLFPALILLVLGMMTLSHGEQEAS